MNARIVDLGGAGAKFSCFWAPRSAGWGVGVFFHSDACLESGLAAECITLNRWGRGGDQNERFQKGFAMCGSCRSRNQTQLSAEMMLHCAGRVLDRPGVLAFSKVVVCLDCGFSQFTFSKAKVLELRSGGAKSAA